MRKKLSALPIAFALCATGITWSPGGAARADTPQACPTDTGLTITCNVQYGASSTWNLMDVYQPTADLGKAEPAVILIHGGGFYAGTDEGGLVPIAEQMAQDGLVTFSIDYTLDSPGHPSYPAAVNDAQSALTYIRDHATSSGQWDIEAGEIGALGTSAGGYLAAMLATCGAPGSPCTTSPVQAAATWSGPVNLASLGCTASQGCIGAGGDIDGFLGCYINTCRSLYTDASPTSYVTSGTAPMLMWNSDNEIIPLSQLTGMIGKLSSSCGNGYRFTVLPGNQHAESYSNLALPGTISFLAGELVASPPTLGCGTSPPWTDAATAFDPDLGSSGEIVAFGGCCNANGTLLNSTRVLTSGSWQTVKPSTKPPARIGASMAWDPALGEVVMFGGETATGDYNTALSDLWAFNGTNWSKVATTGGPPAARSEAAMAYDTNNGQMVLYGGESPLTATKNSLSDPDTWTLTSSGGTSTWTEVLATNGVTPALYGASMATDPGSGDPILFGGDVATSSCAVSCFDLQNGSYEWTGAGWTALPGGAPSPREFASMTAVGGSSPGLVLFGGLTAPGGTPTLQPDTWTWVNGTWSNPKPKNHPPARYDANMAESPVSPYQAIASAGFTGGNTLVTTTYGWTGTVWVKNP